ncbi:MAG: deoxyribose-phosphate aldolase [Flavobacteriaceae bacterium]|nr:deoxyribose-phosphate aldolase [Flavobacteriaceae bacterium]
MKLNKYIDHTLLKPTATKDDIKQLCNEAKKEDFFSVCVNSSFVKLAKKELKNTDVKICSVIGFPLGAMSTKAKVYEAKRALKDGADEIDMVINVGLLKSKSFKKVKNEIRSIKKVMPKNTLKVILETCYLNKEEILKGSELALNAKADFIKTSTGFGTGGATKEDVKLMKNVAKDKMKIKASGGIKDTKTAQEYIALGVERLGTSSGIAIVSGTKSESDY